MKASELREMSVTELNAKLNLRFQHTINQLDNPLRLVAVRKDIARVKTLIGEAERKQA